MSSQRVQPTHPATRRRFANTEYWNKFFSQCSLDYVIDRKVFLWSIWLALTSLVRRWIRLLEVHSFLYFAHYSYADSNYLICGQRHLKGHISECVDGRDGAGRDAVEVGQHKVPEVLQLGQEDVLNMRDNFKKWLILAKLLLWALLNSNNMQSVVQMFKVLNMPRKNEHHYIGANGTFSISVMWMMVVITLMMGWMRLISPWWGRPRIGRAWGGEGRRRWAWVKSQLQYSFLA